MAVHASPLGAVFYVAAAAVFLFAVAGLVAPSRMDPLRRRGADLLRRRWFWIALAGLIAANWGYRLAVGLR
jgi:hypothetical protein